MKAWWRFVPPTLGGLIWLEHLPRGALRFPWAIFNPSLREEMRWFSCMGEARNRLCNQNSFMRSLCSFSELNGDHLAVDCLV
jgi:hypothetical protein